MDANTLLQQLQLLQQQTQQGVEAQGMQQNNNNVQGQQTQQGAEAQGMTHNSNTMQGQTYAPQPHLSQQNNNAPPDFSFLLQLQQQQMNSGFAGLSQENKPQDDNNAGNQTNMMSGPNDGSSQQQGHQNQQQMAFQNFQQSQFVNQNQTQQAPQQNNNNQQTQNSPQPQPFNPQQFLLGGGLFNQMALAGMMLQGQVNPQQLQQLQQLQMAQQLLQQAGALPGMAGLAPQAGIPLQLGLMGNNSNTNASGQFQSNLGGNTLAPGPGKSTGAAGTDGSKTEVEWTEPFAGKGKKEPPFPLKLHQILSNPEFQECICWNPHGRSWRILKPPGFEQVVVPLYFRHAKYASFMRQVNGWGFRRIVSGNDHNSYFHEMFVRDCPQLCMKMKRMKKGVGADPDDEEKEDVEEEAGGSDGEKNQEEESVNNTYPEAEKHNSSLPEVDAGMMADNTTGQVDSATLNKLQEALAAGGAAGSFLQQQTANGEGMAGETGLSHLHESMNKGDLGAGDFDLASQLQAATQPMQ